MIRVLLHLLTSLSSLPGARPPSTPSRHHSSLIRQVLPLRGSMDRDPKLDHEHSRQLRAPPSPPRHPTRRGTDAAAWHRPRASRTRSAAQTRSPPPVSAWHSPLHGTVPAWHSEDAACHIPLAPHSDPHACVPSACHAHTHMSACACTCALHVVDETSPRTHDIRRRTAGLKYPRRASPVHWRSAPRPP